MLEEVLESLLDTSEEFNGAVNVLAKTIFHTYDDDESILYEDDAVSDYNWANGVTKVCIVFPEGVLKTTVSGTARDYDYDTGDYYEEPSYDDWDDDWCEVEYNVYQAAVEAGVGQFFAETVKVREGVYFQERCLTMMCDCFYDHKAYKRFGVAEGDDTGLSVEVEEFMEKHDLYALEDKIGRECVTLFATSYTGEELEALQKFLYDFDINDLHQSNMGKFADGSFKLFDFCGYCSRTADKVKENSVK